MPVRSLSSSVLVWPDHTQVDVAVRAWVVEMARQHPQLLRAAYFGSYARGDWGVGSDLDLIVVVQEAPQRFERRSLAWDLSSLPVPAELLVYTEQEWQRLQEEGGRFARTLAREVMWVYPELVACSLWAIDPMRRRVEWYRVGEEDVRPPKREGGMQDFRTERLPKF